LKKLFSSIITLSYILSFFSCSRFFFLFSRADIVSNRQLYQIQSSPLRRRSSLRINSYIDDHSLNVDYCGESQGCLIVPQQCNNNAKCEYILSWQGLDNERVKFNLIARAQGFAGVGFSTDEKRVNIKQKKIDCSLRNLILFVRVMIKLLFVQKIHKAMFMFIICTSMFKHHSIFNVNDHRMVFVKPKAIRMVHI